MTKNQKKTLLEFKKKERNRLSILKKPTLKNEKSLVECNLTEE
jgi:hypothetical protein